MDKVAQFTRIPQSGNRVYLLRIWIKWRLVICKSYLRGTKLCRHSQCSVMHLIRGLISNIIDRSFLCSSRLMWISSNIRKLWMIPLRRWTWWKTWRRAWGWSGEATAGRAAPPWTGRSAPERPTWTWTWASAETKPFCPPYAAAIRTRAIRVATSPSNLLLAPKSRPNVGSRSMGELILQRTDHLFRIIKKDLFPEWPNKLHLRLKTWQTRVRCQSLARKWTSTGLSTDTEKVQLIRGSTRTFNSLLWMIQASRTSIKKLRTSKNWKRNWKL